MIKNYLKIGRFSCFFCENYLHSCIRLIYIITQTHKYVPILARERKVLMIKLTLLATLFAGLAMGTTVAHGGSPKVEKEVRDTKIIVEVDRSLETLTSQGIYNTQKAVFDSIRTNITSNVRLGTQYHVLNNAFVVSINSKYVDAVKSLPGVKSVTVNKLHIVKTQSYQAMASDDPDPDPAHDYGGSENASAKTMHMDEVTTNEGEGTVIAILDNEFYFRGETEDAPAWGHWTFSPLESTVKTKWSSRPNIADTHAYKDSGFKAIIDAATLGHEGSLYYNSKVPFYFDYGGESESYGGDPIRDLDVSSLLSYHGSHVASIAAGNDSYYKGIAPKAQLVCMKVFTNFEAEKIDEAIGFGSSSGAYDEPILTALEDCITLGVDGINMSLGSNLDDFDAESITMKTLQNLADKGILSSISAGNNGKSSFAFAGGYGNWTSEMVETGILGGYANSAKTMTIAAGQPAKTFYASAFKYKGVNISYEDQVVNWGNNYDYEEDEEKHMSDLVTEEQPNIEWVYIPNFGSSTDYEGKNVTDRIAVVNRGSIDFETKVKTAKDKGAKGVVIINNDPTASDFNFHCSFGEYKPTIPVALVLYKEKRTFEQDGSGIFAIVKNQVDVNPKANTISTFSSDGAAANLDLKPEITAPGDFIRGAVPPQTKQDKKDEEEGGRRHSTYEFLSGTSMSAPNYAGAQSVILSKKANDLKNNQSQYLKYRKTVDMRLMSTAIPMLDYEECPEAEGEHYQTSPRIQGAGMANIKGAYNTDVYLEGYDLNNNLIGKSKIALRNSPAINAGNINLSFLAHNEGTTAKRYQASYTVMRPAIKESNEIVSRQYSYKGEVDSISSFPGMSYWVEQVNPDSSTQIVERHAAGSVSVGDVFKVTKEIKYNTVDNPLAPTQLIEQTIAIGRYKCVDTETVTEVVDEKEVTYTIAVYETLESLQYQSVQDIVIKTVNITDPITVEPGNHKITLPSYSLTTDQKKDILDFYEFGCYLEGYITLVDLDAVNGVNLSMPWMGFFAGEGQDYESAPVVEPFSFEKDATTVYPSELNNDIGYSLLGKSNIDMGSTWATTYVKPGKFYNSDEILQNDESLSHLCATKDTYHLLGTDTSGNFYSDPEDHLYVGNPNSSNTMLIQQFVLRSVDDNYFTLTNKKSGKVVVKDVLTDLIFGDKYGRYPLYKSHVDENYLNPYVGHRAFGVVPLYDSKTGQSFPAGDYEMTFNYKLVATGTWVSKSYTLHLVTDEPTIKSVQVKSDSVRFNISEKYLDKVKVGRSYYEMSEAEIKGNYIELSKDRIESELETNINYAYDETGRLYIELSNKAYGRTGIIVRFEQDDDEVIDFKKWSLVEHYSFTLSNDFKISGNSVEYVTYNASTRQNTLITVDAYARVKTYKDKVSSSSSSSTGCGGNIATTSVILSSLAGLLALALILGKKRKLGGKE